MTLLIVLAFSGCTENDTQKNADNNTTDGNNETENGNEELSGDVVATVNGENITSEEVEELQQQNSQYGQQMSEEDALDQLIDQEVLSQHYQQEEFMPTNEEVEDEINVTLQQNNWSQEQLEQQLEQSGMTYEDYFQSVEEELARQNCLSEAVDEYGVSDEEAEQQINMMLQQYNMTLEQLEQQLEQSGMTYEDYLDQMKQQIVQPDLTDDLREEADIEYL